MVRLYALVLVAQVALAVCALISCLSADAQRVRALPRPAWVPIILFAPLIGSIAWFLVGRPLPPEGSGPLARRRRPPRPLGPDDDPEFLGSLRPDESARDRELFDQWEEDLRRREGRDGPSGRTDPARPPEDRPHPRGSGETHGDNRPEV